MIIMLLNIITCVSKSRKSFITHWRRLMLITLAINPFIFINNDESINLYIPHCNIVFYRYNLKLMLIDSEFLLIPSKSPFLLRLLPDGVLSVVILSISVIFLTTILSVNKNLSNKRLSYVIVITYHQRPLFSVSSFLLGAY